MTIEHRPHAQSSHGPLGGHRFASETSADEDALAADLSQISGVLREVLAAQGGAELVACLDAMQQHAQQAREADLKERVGSEPCKAQQTHSAALLRLAESLDAQQAHSVVRGFTLRFQLVNIAEDVHRVRVLRRRLHRGGDGAVAASLASACAEIKELGANREEAEAILQELGLSFVFTAHPTEARRRTTERLLSRVRELLEEQDRAKLTPPEARATERALRAAVEALWQHGAERRSRPDVMDEVKAGLWVVRHVLLDVVPNFQRRLRRALEMHYGDRAPDAPLLPMPIRFGSWMGGDRDGNPFVSDAVTERTLELHRWIATDRYRQDVEALGNPLAAIEERLTLSARFRRSLERAAAAVPEARYAAERRNDREPLRRFLVYIGERLKRTQTSGAGGYSRATEFLDDLNALRETLKASHAQALADDTLLDLIERVRCFGFHLMSLDLREDGRVMRRVVAELLAEPGFASKTCDERIADLCRLELPVSQDHLSDEASRLLDFFASVRRLHARFGAESLRCVIVSMTQDAGDLLTAYRLAELHRVAGNLDFVPLFETPQALQSAANCLQTLLEHTGYRQHLRERGEIQEVLVGYSDSMKAAGMLASRVGILEAQRAIVAVLQRAGIKPRIFHGRGGSVSRGGGPTHQALRALPSDVVVEDIKITEQGEMRSFNFASPELATRYLEQTFGALWVSAIAKKHRPQTLGEQAERTLAQLAQRSARQYRELVEHPGMLAYFNAATPLAILSQLHIASRPAKRGEAAQTIEDLRAIPWVFAWSQSRQVMTGWYGLGEALAEYGCSEQRRAELEQLARTPFFRDILDNVQMTLCKADISIASRYAELCQDEGVREAIFGRIGQGYALTALQVLTLSGAEALLDNDPVLQRSIRRRNPFVDPLSYLQIVALRRSRSAEAEAKAQDANTATRQVAEQQVEAWQAVARSAVHGVAAGLRVTG